MKRSIIVSIALLFLLPLLLFAAGAVTVKKTETKNMKQVVFDHKIHQKNGVSQCKVCHHSGKIGKSCADAGCHVGPDGTKSVHARCIGCHRTRGGKAPVQCTQCHKK